MGGMWYPVQCNPLALVIVQEPDDSNSGNNQDSRFGKKAGTLKHVWVMCKYTS